MPKLPPPPRSAQNSSGSCVGVRADELAVGGDELDRGQAVGLQAVAAGEPAHAAAERVAGDADVRARSRAARSGRAARRRRRRPPTARRRRRGRSGARRRSRRRPCPEVLTQHRAGSGRRAGRRCGRSTGGATRRPARARGAHDLGDLARVGRVGDGGGALVDGEVEGLARGVVAVVAGEGDGTAAEVAQGESSSRAGSIIVMAGTVAERPGCPRRCREGLPRQVSSASASSPWELAPSLRRALPSLISMIRGVTNSSWAISRSARPAAASAATRRSVAVSDAHAARRRATRARRRRPASRCGSAPAGARRRRPRPARARGSAARARSRGGPRSRRVTPSAASDLASSSRDGRAARRPRPPPRGAPGPPAPSSSPSTRSERATVPGAPQSRARSSSSAASSIALRFMPERVERDRAQRAPARRRRGCGSGRSGARTPRRPRPRPRSGPRRPAAPGARCTSSARRRSARRARGARISALRASGEVAALGQAPREVRGVPLQRVRRRSPTPRPGRRTRAAPPRRRSGRRARTA